MNESIYLHCKQKDACADTKRKINVDKTAEFLLFTKEIFIKNFIVLYSAQTGFVTICYILQF